MTAAITAETPAATAMLDQALMQLLDRIESLLAEERQLLSTGPTDDYDRLIARKNHLIFETMRFSQSTPGCTLVPRARDRINLVRRELNENAELLRRHIGALSEISSLISDVCNRETSDGTYTSQNGNPARRK